MCKNILLPGILICCLSSSGQYVGYTLLSDPASFKEQFSASTRRINSIQCDFEQEKNLGMLSEKISSSGKFFYRRENQVRMEYLQPFQYLMIINNSRVLIRDGQKENTLNTKSNKVFQQVNNLMLDCVKGTALLSPEFSVRIFSSKKNFLIELMPLSKNLKDFFSTITLLVERKDYSVTKIQMNEPSGDNTVIQFNNKELNANVPEALFAVH